MKCKNCPNRHATCHAYCEEYKNWCAKLAELKAETKTKRQAEFYAFEKWQKQRERQAKLKQLDRTTGRKRFKE